METGGEGIWLRGWSVTKRIAVIGAGSSGLVCAKELLAEGHDVTVFEAGHTIGGMFRSSRKGGRAYDSMRLTSSNFVTAFSDHPPEEATFCHWRHEEYIDYLDSYARRFNLYPRICFGAPIRDLHDAGDHWRLSIGGNYPQQDARFDAVAICTGVVERPSKPEFPGQGTFRGKVTHSSEYHNAVPFDGKRVLVIGGGETAVDLVNEISAVTAACHISLRRGVWVIPRLVRGVPNDFHTSRILHGLPRPLLDDLSILRAELTMSASRIPGVGHLVSPSLRLRSRLLLDTGSGVFAQYAVKSEAFLRPLTEGACVRHPGVRTFHPDGVEFVDGSRVEVDHVVMCTGYRQSFGFARRLELDFAGLYRRVFSPPHRERLALIGFARPAIGAIPPIAEMQSRWFAQVVSGNVRLPSEVEMRRHAEAERVARVERFGELGERLVALTDFTPYQDGLAAEIGCKPDLVEIARRDPQLAWRLFVRPFVGAQFRLVGPHAQPTMARQVLARVEPVIQPSFFLFLMSCHTIARAMAALGYSRWRPPLSLRS